MRTEALSLKLVCPAIWLWLPCLMIGFVPCLGIPTINKALGTFSRGATITIQGNDFGAKTPAAPLAWADFEDGTSEPTTLGPGLLWGSSGEITGIGQDVNSKHSMRLVSYDADGKHLIKTALGNVSAETVYVSLRRKYDHPNFWQEIEAGCTGNIKVMHMASRFAPDYSPNLNIRYIDGRLQRQSGGHSTCGFAGSRTSGGGNMAPTQAWLREEYYVTHSTPGVEDGVTKVWINGNLELDRPAMTRGGSCSIAKWKEIVAYTFLAGTCVAPSGAYVYMDDIYMDKTWARVMIGDKPIFSMAKHREVQIPKTWSDNSITITVNPGSFVNGDSAYLFVVDRNGTASLGMPIVVGNQASLFTKDGSVGPAGLSASIRTAKSRRADFAIGLEEAGSFSLSVFDIAGRRIWEYNQEAARPGLHHVKWNAVRGVHFMLLRQDARQITRRFVVAQ